ncbi:MAG: ribosome biogenesis GTPase Der [Candidatus Peregrinibacteria bacterium]
MAPLGTFGRPLTAILFHMTKLPIVAIIGRPNTGKSTLFNRMVGQRKSIESEVPGTTRDAIAHTIETEDVDYLLLDTGGMGIGTLRRGSSLRPSGYARQAGQADDQDLEVDVHKQSLLALANADVIIFTVNGREETTKSDLEIVSLLRKNKGSHVPVLLAVTKCDNEKIEEEALMRFRQLAITDAILPVSAAHYIGVEELKDTIAQELKKLHFTKAQSSPLDTARGKKLKAQSSPRVAIIGRPNVGKSSLINALMSDPQRETSPLLVSSVPGTTRDATDTTIRRNDREYLFIDTAGIRRRRSTEEGIETFAMLRSIRALEECDTAVLITEANTLVSKQDKRIAEMAKEAGKGLIILVNKIDLLKGEERKEKILEVESAFAFCRYAPIVSCSATTREGIVKIFDWIDAVSRNRARRIPTKDLVRWYRDTVFGKPFRMLQSAKFITQAEEVPPTFVLFVRDPKMVKISQLRHLDNNLRSLFAFEGTPIRWITKKSGHDYTKKE